LADKDSFTECRMKWLDQVHEDNVVSPAAFRVAYAISKGFNRQRHRETGALCSWRSQREIASETSMSKRNVQKVIGALVDAGRLSVDVGGKCYGDRSTYEAIVYDIQDDIRANDSSPYPQSRANDSSPNGAQSRVNSETDLGRTERPFRANHSSHNNSLKKLSELNSLSARASAAFPIAPREAEVPPSAAAAQREESGENADSRLTSEVTEPKRRIAAKIARHPTPESDGREARAAGRNSDPPWWLKPEEHEAYRNGWLVEDAERRAERLAARKFVGRRCAEMGIPEGPPTDIPLEEQEEWLKGYREGREALGIAGGDITDTEGQCLDSSSARQL
jgi:hypothetical protein